jgi:hypothetical protein
MPGKLCYGTPAVTKSLQRNHIEIGQPSLARNRPSTGSGRFLAVYAQETAKVAFDKPLDKASAEAVG